MGRLRESSASAIAKLEEELNERNELCQVRRRKLPLVLYLVMKLAKLESIN